MDHLLRDRDAALEADRDFSGMPQAFIDWSWLAVTRSEPLEALELAPALTEASLFAFDLCPKLSCFNAALHRRHGESHFVDDIGVYPSHGVVTAVHTGDQHQLSLISRLSLNRNVSAATATKAPIISRLSLPCRLP